MRKKILFLTLSKMENINERGIYTDLVRELGKRGVKVYIVCPREKRENLSTELDIQENIHILRVKTGNITKTKSLIEKGISTLMIANQYIIAIKKFYSNIKFDMHLYQVLEDLL